MSGVSVCVAQLSHVEGRGDAFDAMTTSRAYCDAFEVDEALSWRRRCAGSQFDPEVVAKFCVSIGASEPATAVFAETGSRSV
jgi:HD-GYP domain-containing protein (c-di-GMP phosphodiesterase class II)